MDVCESEKLTLSHTHTHICMYTGNSHISNYLVSKGADMLSHTYPYIYAHTHTPSHTHRKLSYTHTLTHAHTRTRSHAHTHTGNYHISNYLVDKGADVCAKDPITGNTPLHLVSIYICVYIYTGIHVRVFQYM